MRTLLLASPDGTRLHGVAAFVERPQGVVFVGHGLGEHIGRYAHVFAALNAAGWAAYGVDLRGHGRSGGKRGHILSWSDYVADVGVLHAVAAGDGLAEQPRVQLGHSMGGLVAVHAALADPSRLHGLLLSGPLLGVAADVPPLKAAAGRLLSRLVPALAMATGLKSTDLSHDPEVVRAYDADPLVHDRVSTRWFTEMNAAIAAAQARAGELLLPLLLMHGAADRLTDPAGSRRFLANYGGPQESEFYAGFYHEIFNEVDRARPLQRMTEWLAKLGRRRS